jgi:hypothetical protein
MIWSLPSIAYAELCLKNAESARMYDTKKRRVLERRIPSQDPPTI